MLLQRFLNEHDQIGFGALQQDGSVLRIEGNIYGDFRVTDQAVSVKKILAPIEPTSILCIGLNYLKHAEEGNVAPPKQPVVFSKGINTVQNPGDPILIPTRAGSDEVDFECELGVVIGKRCKNVSREKALDYVLGYTAANDVSSRDWQFKWSGGQWVRSKMFDTFCPFGPVIATPESIPDPNNLKIRTLLNGEVMQDWTTRDMIFDVKTLIAFLSQSTTLLPGTLILTGTPHGVGMARTPPRWLRAGDTVTIELEGVGQITNPVQFEEVPTDIRSAT